MPSRDTFCSCNMAFDECGVDALLEGTRCKSKIANQVDGVIEQAVKDFAFEYLAYGQARNSNELRKYLLCERPVSPT